MQATVPARRAALARPGARTASLAVLGRPLVYLVLIAFAFLAAFPFYWILIGSLMKPVELFARVPRLWPAEPSWAAYVRIFELVPLGRYFFNSIFVALVTVIVAVIVSSAAGYCFALLKFPGKAILFGLTLATLMVPFQTRIIPLFVMFTGWGLNNTYAGLIIPGLASAFGVFMMTQFFQSLPAEMREAAVIDGASELRIFWQVFLPLARPGVATLALFTFTQSWDALLWPMIIAPTPDMRTLQVGLAFINQTALTWNNTMAAVVLATVPVILAFFLAQGQFIAGISAGAVKE
jgi:ABC-type glycerol-3-phosphate transport system permease component